MPISLSDLISCIFNMIIVPLISSVFFVRVQKDIRIKKWLIITVTVAVGSIVALLNSLEIIPRAFSTVLFQSLIICVALFTSRDRPLNKFINLIVYYIVMTLLDIFVYALTSFSPSTSGSILIILFALLLSLTLYFSEQFIKSFRDKKLSKKSFVFLLIPVSQAITYASFGFATITIFPRYAELLNKSNSLAGMPAIILSAAVTLSLIADIIAFKQYVISLDMAQIEAENKALEYQNQLNLNYFSELKENETELRKIKHDISGCLETMKEIIYTEKDTEKAQHFFDELSMTLGNITTGFYCKNSLINAIIISKSKICDKQGIRLSAEIKIPEALNISDTDICRILVNMLDNAIEANEKEDKNKFIDLSIKENDGFIYLSTRNPFSGENIGSTTKENKKEHGYGLRILNDFAQKYDGYFKAESQSNTLSSLVVLKNEYSDN